MKAVIVEDEALSQKFLEKLISDKYPDISIVKVLDSIKDSIEYFSKETVDLIFMDIQLRDGYCFNIFEEVEIITPIIFTTAFDEYAIKAFEQNSISYILKPLDEDKLEMAMNKFFKISSPNNNVNLQNLLSALNPEIKYKKRITIRLGDRIIIVEEKDIAYFIAENRTCYIYTKDNNKYIVDFSLDTISSQLNPKVFYRISRDCITTFSSIKDIKRYYKGRLSISLIPDYGKSIIISKERVSDFMEWLNGE
ncbi:MAG: LytTR family DNA-binding domain-containing protein [Bacteroidales bacterium]|jgi:DNA-binding LytR/AlgR family response regulator